MTNPEFDFTNKENVRRVIALLTWMDHINNNANLAHISFRNGKTNHLGFTDIKSTELGFWNENEKELIEKYGNNPDINDFRQLMMFIEAINGAGGAGLTLDNLSLADFDRYPNQPSVTTLNTLTTPGGQRALANQMLDTLTQYKKYNFGPLQENLAKESIKDEDKDSYDDFNRMYAHTVMRMGSGVAFTEEGNFWWRIGGFLATSVVALTFFPVIVLVGGVFTLPNLYKRFYNPDFGNNADRTSLWFSSWDAGMYPIGESGRKYWAQAKLDIPGKNPWASSYFFHNLLGSASITAVTVVEAVVEALFFPFKLIVSFLSPDNLIRRAVYGLKDFTIGVLSSPVIFINYMYAGLMDVIDKFISHPSKDPDLIKYKDTFRLNLENPKWNDWLFIVPFKILRLITDTIPAILTNGIIGTLRSVLPAMPGTTQETRDKFFTGLSNAVYWSLFIMVVGFLGTVALSALGVTIPSAITSIFGAADPMWGKAGAETLFKAYANQITNVVTSVFNGAYNGVIDTAKFMWDNIHPGDLFKSSFDGLADAFHTNLNATQVAVTTIASSVGGVALIFGLSKWYEAHQEKATIEKANEKKIDVADSASDIKKKAQDIKPAQGPSIAAPSALLFLKTQLKITDNKNTKESDLKNQSSLPKTTGTQVDLEQPRKSNPFQRVPAAVPSGRTHRSN